ncbi:MAG: ABC transporter ATP-binding protein [Candidatus Paceibacterota bacterium]
MLSFLKKLKEVLYPASGTKLFILFALMILGAFLELLGIGVIMIFVSAVADISILFDIKWLLPFLNFFNINNSRDVLVYGSVILAFTFVFKNAYLVSLRYIKARFVYNRYRNISNRLFSFYMNAPYYFHLQRNSADSIRNISIEAENLSTRVIMPIFQIIIDGAVTLAIVLMLFIIEPFITVIVLFLLLLISFLFLKAVRKYIIWHGKRAFEKRREIIQIVSEGMGGIKDILISGRKGWFIEKFRSNINDLSKASAFQQTITQSTRPVMESIAVLGMIFIAFLLLYFGRPIPSLISTLVLFAFSAYRLLPAINNLINEYMRVRHFSFIIDPIYNDLISSKEQESRQNKKEERMVFKEEIRIENVSYTYPKSTQEALKNVSFAVKKGEAVGIIGPTGCGKTTIADIILGLLEPTKGKIEVDKKNIRENIDGWQKNIGYVPQFIYLSDDTIYNNIAFGIDKEKIDKSRLLKAAKVACLDDFVKKLPKGLDTFIGERGIRLSGGQRQRIGIARAIYYNPEILVMDEATSSLDNITEKYVIEAIERLKEGRTVIIIAHRLTTVKNCDILYMFKEGRIVGSGTYKDLLERNSDFKLMADSA